MNNRLTMMTMGLMMPLTAEELTTITGAVKAETDTLRATHSAELAALQARLDDAESRATAASNRPAIYGADGSPAIRSVPQTKDERREHVIRTIGNAARGLAIAQRSRGVINPTEYIEKELGDRQTALALTRSMSVGVAGNGGNLVETAYAAEMIELLYPTAVVRNMGARILPMPTGNMTLHRQSTGVTGRYEGELNNIQAQQPTTDSVQMSAKKLAVIVPASNELLHDTSGRANQLIVDDIGMGLSLTEDLKFLRGDGTNNTPTGILNQVAGTNIVVYTKLTALLGGLRTLPRKANVAGRRYGWVFNADVESLAYNAMTDNGDYMYREEMDQGRLLGYPYRISNQIPSNLAGVGGAGNTNGTEVYFGDWSEVMIGETMQLSMDTSTEGTYFNGSELVSAYSTDQTLYRAITRHDLGLRHTRGMAIGKFDIVAGTLR